jgi:glycosyltransferase involved in cell wall biosynthesis
MPCHNSASSPERRGRLDAAVSSVLSQSLADFEFVIVDDGSEAATARHLARLAAADARVRVVTLPANAGVAAALNEGIRRSSADFIARMDDDDFSFPDRLETQAAFLADNPPCAVVGSAACFMDEFGRIIGVLRRMPTHAGCVALGRNGDSPFIHGSVMFRREAALRAGLYSEYAAYRWAEDYEFWRRLLREGEGRNLERPLYLYRSHAGGVSQSKRAEQDAAARRIRDAYLAVFPDGGNPAPRDVEALWTPVDSAEERARWFAESRGPLGFLVEDPSDAKARLFEAEQRLDEMTRSTSWRISKPVRVVGASLKALFRKGEC